MMHTSYTSSNSIISLRTYSAFNNDCFYYSNDKCPSNYCSCCCSFPINSCKLILPTNPKYLFGLRQSTLIQCPPSRRFVLGSSDRVFGRLSNSYDVGCCCCLESCGVKKEKVDRIVRSDCNCKETCCVSNEKGIDLNRIKSRVGRPKRDFRSNALGDVEAMLSLLSEANVEDCGVVREKRRSSFKDGNVGSKRNVAIEKLKDRKPNVGSVYRESDPKNGQLDLGRFPRPQPRPREEKRENVPKDEDQALRRRESSSSYYSFSDSGEFESDQEVELKQEQSVGESSSSGHIKDLRKSGGVIINEETEKDWVKRRNEKEQVVQSSATDDLRVSGSIQRDWRKKSEKKLTDESEETKFRNEYVAKKSQLSQAQESSSTNASSSKKQLNYQKEQSTSDTKSLGPSNIQIIKDDRASRYSKSSNQHEHSMQIDREDVETTSSAWKRFSQGEDSKIIGKSVQKTGCDYCKTCGRSMEENKTRSGVQRHDDRSETSIDAKLAINGESLSESSRHGKHERSSIAVPTSVDEGSRQHDQIHMVTGQASAKRKSQHYHESIDSSTQSSSRETQQLEAHNMVDKSRTNTESQSGSSCRKEEKSSFSFQTSVKGEEKQHDKIYRRTSQAFDARNKTQHYSEVMDTDASYLQSTSNAQQSETRKKHLEEKKTSIVAAEEAKTSLQTSVSEKYDKHDEIYQRTGQTFDARRKSQHSSEVINSDASYLQSTSNTQQQSEIQKKHLEEKKTSFVAAEEAKRLRDDSARLMTKDIESSKFSHTDIGDSRVHSSNLEINSQSASDKRVYKEQTSSKLKLKSVEESVEKHNLIDETIAQSRTELQGPSTRHISGTATRSNPSAPSISLSEVQQFSGELQSGQLSVTSPPYQCASRLPMFPEASSDPVKKDMGRTTKVGSDSMQKFSLASSPSSYGEDVDSRCKSGEKHFPEDALNSAARMQDTSSLIVGDFVEKMSNEASASETSIEQKLSNWDSKDYTLKGSTQSGSEDALASAAYMQESSSRIAGEFVEKMRLEASAFDTSIEKKITKVNIKHQDKSSMLKGSTQSDSDTTGLQKHGVEYSSGVSSPDLEKEKAHELNSSSSGDSGTKGSTDQMWDVKDHFVEEAAEVERLEGATTESVNPKRTGKSLLNVVSGVLRLRWGSHTEKQKSPVKGQSSPSKSASGETWISDNEADAANDDGMKAEKICLLQGTSSDQCRLRTTRSQKKDVVMSLDEESSHVDMGASSSSSVLQSSSLSGGAIEGENANLIFSQNTSKPSPSLELSTPGKLRRSLDFEEDDGAEKIEALTSSSDEQRDISVDVRQTSASASKGTDVELKRKKLQRSKVVLQRFEDWEDAYRRDREQRKVDEIFMREALSEAIKAADSWEVPVGAVLVYNGNIIARGYNLVEELRDSTAHAEMLCIKEGSNVLRTWRLSETTLYVTLEPCPMCAGAIMQSRISTLVWGAPNKLLGADGSWIRLFPEGMEGEPRAEVTDKPAAPAHPFHPNMKIRRGILEEECADIMQQFFQLRRRRVVKEKKAETSSEESESVQPTCFPKPHHRSKLLHKMHNVIHRSKQSSD